MLSCDIHLTAVEIDSVLAKQLPETVCSYLSNKSEQLTVLNQSILKITALDLIKLPTIMISSLPYNIAVPVILHILENFPSIHTIVVIVQSEIAERLIAKPGEKKFGIPSVKLSFYSNKICLYDVISPTVFWPVPKVHSRPIRIERYRNFLWPTDCSFRNEVFQLINISFSQRRKTSHNAFTKWTGSKSKSLQLLKAANIDPLCRSEALGIEDFIKVIKIKRHILENK